MNRKYKLRYRLAFGFASLFLVCSIHALEGPDFEGALLESLSLCSDIASPDRVSSLREPELTNHLRDLENQRKKTSKLFASAVGVEFLEKKLRSEVDELRAICLVQTIAESRTERARTVLETIASDPRRPAVQERAQSALAQLMTHSE